MNIIQIEELIEAFSNKTLPISEWTHEAHIIVAFWHNWHYDFHDAFAMVRKKIIAYNESVGTPNTNTSGYHETLTRFWMTLTKNHILENNHSTLDKACSSFIILSNLSKFIPLEYYTKDILFSKEARKKWVNGNIKELQLLKSSFQKL
ncbi:MAG: hypothetical protein AAF806_06575 [Bacteroidota bacterium]